MIASVHVADVGVARAARALAQGTARMDGLFGLDQANLALAAPLSSSVVPALDVGRLVLVATWENDAALDQFFTSSGLASRFEHGWHVRLAPIRATGTWGALTSDLPQSRTVVHEGPVVVLTLGQLRFHRAVAFFRASAVAEAQVVRASGLLWATGMGKPPFVGTCSLWESSDAVRDYAYGDRQSGHGHAMAADRHDPFHQVSAFVRLRPYESVGGLDGSNPLAADWLHPERTT